MTTASAAPALQRTIDFIDSHTSPGERTLDLPADAGLNFMTDRPPALYDVMFLPGLLDSRADERKAIARLEREGVRYAVISKRRFDGYGFSRFGVDYNHLLASYVERRPRRPVRPRPARGGGHQSLALVHYLPDRAVMGSAGPSFPVIDPAAARMNPNSENGLPPSGPPRLEDVRALILSASGAHLPDPEAAIAGGADDLDLRGSGMIDSLGFIELVAAIEDSLEIEIDFEGIDPDQITTLGPLAHYVHAQAEAAAGSLREK